MAPKKGTGQLFDECRKNTTSGLPLPSAPCKKSGGGTAPGSSETSRGERIWTPGAVPGYIPGPSFPRAPGHRARRLFAHARPGQEKGSAICPGDRFRRYGNPSLRPGTFDKTVSVTALEFIADGSRAVQELFR